MVMTSPHSITNLSHIRKVDLFRDLDNVADLIEGCFPIHLDQDGQTYIKEMRKAARDMQIRGWLTKLVSIGSINASGFVCEQNEKIIGNLSLIPFQKQGHRIHLIANVAVHPDHRRQGIARALTNRALAYLKQQNEPNVWLQVRDDNQEAIELYRSVGFVDRFIRSTWRIRPIEFQTALLTENIRFNLRRRNHGDWDLQKQWLDENYPTGIRWNLPVEFHRFEPNLLQWLSNKFDGLHFRQWAFDVSGECQVFITWQKTTTFANNLWLAVPADLDDEVLAAALDGVRKRLSKRHPLSIDYPKGRHTALFKALGFYHFRSLIWMSLDLN